MTAELVPSLDEPPHLAVVHDGTVVSVPGPARRTPAQEAVDSPARLDPSGFNPGGFDATSTPREVVVDLAACGTDGEPLPPGRYDVYAWTDAASPGQRVVDGPWDLELLEPVTTPVPLPAGYRTDVPLVHGELVEAVALDAGRRPARRRALRDGRHPPRPGADVPHPGALRPPTRNARTTGRPGAGPRTAAAARHPSYRPIPR